MKNHDITPENLQKMVNSLASTLMDLEPLKNMLALISATANYLEIPAVTVEGRVTKGFAMKVQILIFRQALDVKIHFDSNWLPSEKTAMYYSPETDSSAYEVFDQSASTDVDFDGLLMGEGFTEDVVLELPDGFSDSGYGDFSLDALSDKFIQAPGCSTRWCDVEDATSFKITGFIPEAFDEDAEAA